MATEPGATFGHYQILAAIGKGGPPPFASEARRELRRDLAEAKAGQK